MLDSALGRDCSLIAVPTSSDEHVSDSVSKASVPCWGNQTGKAITGLAVPVAATRLDAPRAGPVRDEIAIHHGC